MLSVTRANPHDTHVDSVTGDILVYVSALLSLRHKCGRCDLIINCSTVADVPHRKRRNIMGDAEAYYLVDAKEEERASSIHNRAER